MPDDERRRRRLGDETKGRIADLASGWSVDAPSPEPPAAPAQPAPSTPSAPAQIESTKPRVGDETRNRIDEMSSGWSVDAKIESTKPRLGDETRNRIDEMSSGWSVDAPPTPPPEPVRKKPRTNPPPPPGSPERKALEDKIVATGTPPSAPMKPATNPPSAPMKPATNPPSAPRPKPATSPPPIPPAPPRAKPASIPPIPAPPAAAGRAPTSGPKFPRAAYDGPAPPFVAEQGSFVAEQGSFVAERDSVSIDKRSTSEPRTPPVIVDDSLRMEIPVLDPGAPAGARSAPVPAPPARSAPVPAPAAAPSPKLAVPVGEFDSGVRTVEDTAPRPSQQTIKRDPAEALLKIPDREVSSDLLEDDDAPAFQAPTRGDPTAIDPQTAKFERGDPTQDKKPDATEIQPPSIGRHPTGGTLRVSAALRRKRGLLGDVRYVFTAVLGVRRARRELAELEHRQGLRQTSRRRHLVTLGRTAVVTDAFDHPALGKAHEALQAIEDERSKHAGAVAASDAELERVRRDRDTKAKQYVAELSAADAELAELGKKLEPLEKEAASARKRAQELREALQRVDKKLADTEALLVSVKGEKMDKAGIQADIATLKADRQAVLRDEPVIATELDTLNPRIAAIEASRAELQKKKQQLEKDELEDQRRTAELLEAIGAKRKVVERASAEAEAARDNALFELGERLYVDRPKVLAAQLSPIDQIDLELGEGDRRTMEIKEILSNVDKAKLARGLAMILLALAAAGSFVAWLLYMLL